MSHGMPCPDSTIRNQRHVTLHFPFRVSWLVGLLQSSCYNTHPASCRSLEHHLQEDLDHDVQKQLALAEEDLALAVHDADLHSNLLQQTHIHSLVLSVGSIAVTLIIQTLNNQTCNPTQKTPVALVGSLSTRPDSG